MNDLLIQKDNLPEHLDKYFKKEYITINDLINVIDDLEYEIDHYKQEIEELKYNPEEDFMFIAKRQKEEAQNGW